MTHWCCSELGYNRMDRSSFSWEISQAIFWPWSPNIFIISLILTDCPEAVFMIHEWRLNISCIRLGTRSDGPGAGHHSTIGRHRQRQSKRNKIIFCQALGPDPGTDGVNYRISVGWLGQTLPRTAWQDWWGRGWCAGVWGWPGSLLLSLGCRQPINQVTLLVCCNSIILLRDTVQNADITPSLLPANMAYHGLIRIQNTSNIGI